MKNFKKSKKKKGRKEKHMQEEKRRRGRPATGRVRDTQLVIRTTREERDFFKAQAAEHHLTLTDYFLMIAKKK